MNYSMIFFIIGWVFIIEAALMAPSALVAVLYSERSIWAFAAAIGLCLLLGVPLVRKQPANKVFYAKEGCVTVALSWIVMSLMGALPFVFSGVIPSIVDAMFETVSGFTTTGASILKDVEVLPRCMLFWRSFTHWIGGMGVLVLTLALLPQMTGRSSHLVRAESPGPSLSKIVPKMGDTAKILYLIYGALTVIELAALIIAGMSPYDAAIHAMGTAGTGGFSNYGSSVGAFDSAVIDAIITFFMVLFGINFALFYRVLVGGWRDALRSEELHWYLALFAGSTLFVSLMILPQYGTFLNALRYGSFQVATIMSTTGYATADFNLWPQAVKALIVVLMFIGSCAGSTAGGIKVVRVGILCKLGCREVRRTFQPRKVQVVRFEGKGVEENRLTQVSVFFFVYVLLVLVGMFLVSLEGLYDLETNFTAVLTCISNVGPGLGHVGPVENFSGYGPFAKVVLSLLMLAGRLELFPILVLFHPSAWRKG